MKGGEYSFLQTSWYECFYLLGLRVSVIYSNLKKGKCNLPIYIYIYDVM